MLRQTDAVAITDLPSWSHTLIGGEVSRGLQRRKQRAYHLLPVSSPRLSTRLKSTQSAAMGAARRWSGMPNASTSDTASVPSSRHSSGTAVKICTHTHTHTRAATRSVHTCLGKQTCQGRVQSHAVAQGAAQQHSTGTTAFTKPVSACSMYSARYWTRQHRILP